MKFRILFLILLSTLFLPQALFAEDLSDPIQRSYQLYTDFRSFEKRVYQGKLNITLENKGEKGVQDVVLVLYPNRFQEKLNGLNDVNFRRVYPDGVSTGKMTLSNVKDENGQPLRVESVPYRDFPKDTFVNVHLFKELRAKEKQSLSLSFEVQVPEKFGSFGFYRDVMTLSGGWFPYVASFRDGQFQLEDLPTRFDIDLAIDASGDVVVGDQIFKRIAKEQRISKRAQGVRELSLWIAPKARMEKWSDRFLDVSVVYSEGVRVESERFSELVMQWFEFLKRQAPLAQAATSFVVAFAPLRESMVVRGEGVTFISDRAFKVIEMLEQYHSVPMIHGLFYQLLISQASMRENSRDYAWVAEAVAWSWTERFLEDRDYVHTDARTLPPLRAFKFLYAIDRLLYAPQFAFYDVFYNLVYPYDPVRDDVMTFNHRRAPGRTIYAHMEDEFGAYLASKICAQYIDKKGTLLEEMDQVSGKSNHEKYALWVTPRPSVNYQVLAPKSVRTENGFHHEIEVEKNSPPFFKEPVELLVRSKKEEPKLLKWDGEGQKNKFVFDTKHPLSIVELDPRQRLLENDLSDNRIPPRYKAVLTNYDVSFDFNEKKPIGFASLQIRKEYGGYHLYNATAYYDINQYGAGVSYTHLFGRLIDRLRLSHGIDFGYGFSRLARDLAVAEDPAAGTLQLVELSPAAFKSSVGVTYFFGNQLSLTNPMQGGGAGISFVLGNKYLGGDSTYYQSSIAGSWIYPIHPSHLLAFRGLLGLSGPDDLPSQVVYSLGGLDAMRGVSVSEDQFKGRNIILSSMEYRHFLFQDIDLNFWLFRIRDIQGALFTDAGRVSDTLQERANRIAAFSSQQTSFSDLFHFSGYSADAGYGIRFHVDYLGVNPGLFRFDAAKSLTEDSNFRFYFGVTQSF